MKNQSAILLFFSLLFWGLLHGQEMERFNSFSYNVNEGLLQSHTNDLAFDKNNFGWLSFANGIQKFDGNSFINIPIQNGLPDDKSAHFFTTSKGGLLVSHSQGISRYDVQNNSFVQIWQNNATQKVSALFLGEDDNTIYFFTPAGNIEGMDAGLYKQKSIAKTDFKRFVNTQAVLVKPGSNIVQHKLALYIDSAIVLWDLKEKKQIASVKVPNASPYFRLWLTSATEVVYISLKNRNELVAFDFVSKKERVISALPSDLTKPLRGKIFKWKNKHFISYYNNIYETDSFLIALKKTIVNFHNLPVAGNVSIDNIEEDKLGNLYLLTSNAGIRKIIQNNFPIKYYGANDNKNSFCVTVYADKSANRILCGVYGNGLQIFDTLQHLVKHIEVLPKGKGVFTPTSIAKAIDGSYLLFCWGKKEVWNLSANLDKMVELPAINSYSPAQITVNYYSNIIFTNSKTTWVHSSGVIYKADLVTKKIEYCLLGDRTQSGCLLYKNWFITHSDDQLVFLDTATFEVVKKIPLQNTGGVRCFATDSSGNIYIGTNKGVFVTDANAKLLFHLTKETGLSDECIYAMLFDKDGGLWCSTNRGLTRINKIRVTLQLNKNDGLQENEFNSNAAMLSSDGEMYFGGVNGITSFYPADIMAKKENINLLVTRIKINHNELVSDTAVWNTTKLDLPYYRNSLSFDFIGIGNTNPQQYTYQYKMDGVDEQWIPNSDLQTVRYLLPPGNYTFKIYASRFFDSNAKPLKEIKIKIHPPFWKTWWFVSLIALLMLSIIIYVVNQYNKRKYTKKLIELESERKMQVERERISRDLHDNIGAYANAVLYKTDLLQHEENSIERNELMNDLKFASKDIITSLRETIWALKKEKYTAQDCMMRISNFITPLNRFYKNIYIAINGQAPVEKEMHYTKALNLVRIVQEAVSNAIKHANATNISVTSILESEGWKIRIADNGIGFNQNDKQELQEGNGLTNMRERSAEAGFVFDIQSAVSGTIITVLVL